MTKVFILNGEIEHIGDWDYALDLRNYPQNPWQGEGSVPDDWDEQMVSLSVATNPMPEGIVEASIEIFFDRKGTPRDMASAPDFEIESRLSAANIELAELMTDVMLGLATDADKARAVELRTFIKHNT